MLLWQTGHAVSASDKSSGMIVTRPVAAAGAVAGAAQHRRQHHLHAQHEPRRHQPRRAGPGRLRRAPVLPALPHCAPALTAHRREDPADRFAEVLRHPQSCQSADVLVNQDVRYVVLYKFHNSADLAGVQRRSRALPAGVRQRLGDHLRDAPHRVLLTAGRSAGPAGGRCAGLAGQRCGPGGGGPTAAPAPTGFAWGVHPHLPGDAEGTDLDQRRRRAAGPGRAGGSGPHPSGPTTGRGHDHADPLRHKACAAGRRPGCVKNRVQALQHGFPQVKDHMAAHRGDREPVRHDPAPLPPGGGEERGHRTGSHPLAAAVSPRAPGPWSARPAHPACVPGRRAERVRNARRGSAGRRRTPRRERRPPVPGPRRMRAGRWVCARGSPDENICPGPIPRKRLRHPAPAARHTRAYYRIVAHSRQAP